MLPDGGRALVDREQPGREFFLEQQRIGKLGIAVVGEGVEQIRRADKAGGQTVAVGVDKPGELIGN